jgi:subtilisin family serine protease
MSARRLVLILALMTALSMEAAAAVTVIVQPKKNVPIDAVANALGGTVLDVMPDGSSYLMSLPVIPNNIPGNVQSITVNSTLTLPRFKGAAFTTSTTSGNLPWYANQPAMLLVNNRPARLVSTGRGVIIADIDTTIDVNHPALRGHMLAGKDFVNGSPKTQAGATINQSSASFLDDQSTASFLDQSTASFLDQSTASFLDQSTASFLDDQSTASFLDQSTASFLDSHNPGHGHGTMVAGIIAALAPDALIMPLRAFDDSGTGDAFVVAKAIRYAALNGAQVINLSLGLTTDASEVSSAVDFAIKRGVLVVASAGNGATATPQFPAALPNVIGVGATDLLDRKASFSNYGPSVAVMAPGVNIITAYPGGYAIASGTSFSTAFVSAEAALIRALKANGVTAAIEGSAVKIDNLNPTFAGKLGYGRIDLLGGVSGF